MITIIRTKKSLETEQQPILIDEHGRLTRAGAQAKAREKYGDLGSISSDEGMPRLVWKSGEFYQTIGRGKTWEEALMRSRPSKTKKELPDA